MEQKNELNNNGMPEILKTGKIGNLAKNIENETNRSVMLKIMEDANKFKSASESESESDGAEKAEWIKKIVELLERLLGKEKSIGIMENCGRDCYQDCREEHEKYKILMNESKSIEEFLNKISIGGINYKLKNKNKIIGEYNKCYCSIVKQTKEFFPTKIYCHCGIGHVKQLFESALEKPVEVKLAYSIITGARTCKFIIRI